MERKGEENILLWESRNETMVVCETTKRVRAVKPPAGGEKEQRKFICRLNGPHKSVHNFQMPDGQKYDDLRSFQSYPCHAKKDTLRFEVEVDY